MPQMPVLVYYKFSFVYIEKTIFRFHFPTLTKSSGLQNTQMKLKMIAKVTGFIFFL